MKPFNLERAVAGDPLMTRDGRKVIDFHYFEKNSMKHPFYFHCENEEYFLQAADIHGKIFFERESPYDLFMAPKVHTYWISIFKNEYGKLFASPELFSSEIIAKGCSLCPSPLEFIKTISVEIEEW